MNAYGLLRLTALVPSSSPAQAQNPLQGTDIVGPRLTDDELFEALDRSRREQRRAPFWRPYVGDRADSFPGRAAVAS